MRVWRTVVFQILSNDILWKRICPVLHTLCHNYHQSYRFIPRWQKINTTKLFLLNATVSMSARCRNTHYHVNINSVLLNDNSITYSTDVMINNKYFIKEIHICHNDSVIWNNSFFFYQNQISVFMEQTDVSSNSYNFVEPSNHSVISRKYSAMCCLV